ncbi:MAG TPA: alanine racemase [Kofleriaceae bacterium]|nr:alanine racemase [Kofleriaceae bacterium]
MSSAAAIRPTRVEIDLGALRANAALVRRIAGVDLYAVVKADAYGHGAVAVAAALAGAPGVAGLAVSLVEEGSQLRDAGIGAPVLVMGPALHGGYEELVGRDLTALVTDPGDLEALAAIGRLRGAPVAVHLKVDTGMGRLGIRPEQVGALVDAALARGGLDIAGVATHFACAETDDPGDPACLTRQQLERLAAAVAAVRAAGGRPRVVHAANSAGALRFAAARLDGVRTGIALYGNGVAPPEGALRQAMRLRTEVAQVRELPAGGSVGYGALWRAARPSRLAVLPVGYADGYPRNLTGRAEVLIAGRRCPVVGAISMDITVVDVTALPGPVAPGDEAVLLGGQGAAEVKVAELAERAGILPYEVTCGISKRVPRVHAEAA